MPRVSVKRSRKAGVVNEPLSGRSDSRPSRTFDDATDEVTVEDSVSDEGQSGDEPEQDGPVSEPETNGTDAEPNGTNGDQTPSTVKNRWGGSARNSDIDARIQQYKEELAAARRKVTLFRAPLTTLGHFFAVVWDWLQGMAVYLMTHQTLLFTVTLLVSLFLGLSWTPGVHEPHLAWLEAQVTFIVWWVGLGIASAIGLGTGLHTFVLYTMPYIIEVGTTAVECQTLNFAAEGPNAFECPPEPYERQEITFFGVYRKVAAACFLWGAGTAIGELPPYFVARAARLTGQKLEELEEIQQQNDAPPTFADSMKHKIFDALQNYGFIAIMLFASVPNPLFDLCGLTCGHFLVPFWTFFGATVIGKAVNKVTGQAWAVIYVVLNNQDSLKTLHESSKKQGNWLSHLWDLFIMVVVGIFLLSIVTASVQERLATIDQQKLLAFKEKLRPSAGPGSARTRVRLLAE